MQGGALLGALDRAAQPHGLATTAGNVSHTGVGGLTLGGGMGWLARRHGLACDNVASYTVVTADGELVRASADEHPDLFWGLRGGGGNFGIVVEFEFRLHHVGTRALVADLSFPMDRAAAALRGWRELAEVAPREATLTAEIARRHGDAGLRVGRGAASGDDRCWGRCARLGRRSARLSPELSYLALQTRDDSAEGSFAATGRRTTCPTV